MRFMHSNFRRYMYIYNVHVYCIIDIKEEDVRSHFDSCGKIRNVRVIRDSKSGVGKGICYVTFKVKYYKYFSQIHVHVPH